MANFRMGGSSDEAGEDVTPLTEDETRSFWRRVVTHPDDPPTRALLEQVLRGGWEERTYLILIEVLLEENARLRVATGQDRDVGSEP